jgi:hypothetical protein
LRHLLKCLATFSCISLVTGCAIKQTSNVSIEDYTNIENTPVYILNNPPLQPEDLNADILSCTDTTEHRLKVENGILKTTGGLTAATGIISLVSIAASGGILAPLFIPVYATMTAIGGGLYVSANATETYREYTTMEKCLERQGYEVVFISTEKKEQ